MCRTPNHTYKNGRKGKFIKTRFDSRGSTKPSTHVGVVGVGGGVGGWGGGGWGGGSGVGGGGLGGGLGLGGCGGCLGGGGGGGGGGFGWVGVGVGLEMETEFCDGRNVGKGRERASRVGVCEREGRTVVGGTWWGRGGRDGSRGFGRAL